MREQISSWLAPSAPDPELARRQYLLNLVLLGLAGPGFLFGLVMAVMWALGRAPITGALAGFAVQPFYLLAYWLGRRGRVRLAAYIPVVAVFLVMVGGSYQVGIGHVTLIGYAMVTLTAGFLIGNGAALLFTLLSTVAYVIVGMAQTAGRLPGALPPEATVIADAAGLGLGLVVLVIFNWLSAREMSRTLRHERELSAELQTQRATLEQQVAERTHDLALRTAQLESINAIAAAISQVRDLDELLNLIARQTAELIGAETVAVPLLSEDGARLTYVAVYGRLAANLTGRTKSLSDAGICTWVMRTQQEFYSDDLAADEREGQEMKKALGLRTVISAPMLLKGKIVGAITAVNRRDGGLFTRADLEERLRPLAHHAAVAIENARLFEQTQTSLREAEALYRDYSKETWGALVRAGRVHGYTYDRIGISPVTADRPPEVQQALEERHIVAVGGKDGGSEATLAIPVSVRGKAIGVLDIHKSKEAGEWTPEEMALAERVSDQLGLAMESARLYQDTQRRAARERLASEVTARIREHVSAP
jgi:GAF domain-containing protein